MGLSLKPQPHSTQAESYYSLRSCNLPWMYSVISRNASGQSDNTCGHCMLLPLQEWEEARVISRHAEYAAQLPGQH